MSKILSILELWRTFPECLLPISCNNDMGLNARKPVFRVREQQRLRPVTEFDARNPSDHGLCHFDKDTISLEQRAPKFHYHVVVQRRRRCWTLSMELWGIMLYTFERWHEISNYVVCATSKGSDQPAHTHRLIRAFADRLNILWLLNYWPNLIYGF